MEIINKNKIFFSILVVLLIILAIFFIWRRDPQVDDIQYVKIAGQKIKVDLALTSIEQGKGLSGKKELKKDTGMLFVFDHSDNYTFWMKDMNFPIDIIWFDENLNVVFVKKNATPESYPESFSPNQNSKYVLEVYSGFSENNNLKVGEKVEFLSS